MHGAPRGVKRARHNLDNSRGRRLYKGRKWAEGGWGGGAGGGHARGEVQRGASRVSSSSPCAAARTLRAIRESVADGVAESSSPMAAALGLTTISGILTGYVTTQAPIQGGAVHPFCFPVLSSTEP